MKKLLMLFLLLLVLSACISAEPVKKKKSSSSIALENTIISKMEKELPGEKFYFTYGIDEEKSISTNIRYRGILYSDRLKEMNAPYGLEIAKENSGASGADIYQWSKQYEGVIRRVEIDSIVTKKAREIFGAKVNLENEFTMTDKQYQHLKRIMGKKGLTRDEKNGASTTVVNLFVNDLENLNIDEHRKKVFELAKFIYEHMNYVTSLQIYIRDDSYFENLELVKQTIHKSFIEKEDVKYILYKVENKVKLTEKEKGLLVRYFKTGYFGFSEETFKKILINFYKKNNLPIELKKVIFYNEYKNGKFINHYKKYREEEWY